MVSTVRRILFHPTIVLLATLATGAIVGAGDAPMFGYDATRNMGAAEKNLPTAATPGTAKEDGGEIDAATTKNVKWAAKLGSEVYGNPTVAGGRVYAGTNNAVPRDKKYVGENGNPIDLGILACFDEATGKFLWQLACPKLGAGPVMDADNTGLCSPATVENDRAYLVTSRCEVICLDAKGLSDGNAGPFVDEAQYAAGPGKPPVALGTTDADIVWRYDLRFEHGVFPQQMTSSSALPVGDRLYVTTSNGVDWTGSHKPAPQAPALIVLDKITGKLLGEERSGISERTLYCNWSSPAFGTVGGTPTLVFGGGDGFLYGFDPEPVDGVLKELWRIDCNPPEYRAKDGKSIRYKDSKGPSEIIATPVIHGDRVYVAIGQDPEYPEGAGCLNAIAVAGGKADYAWRFTKIGRSMSTAAIADGLLYTADGAGIVYCMDVATGATVWQHDTQSHIFGSTLLADGKLYVGNEQGDVTILAAGREVKELGKIEFGAAINSTPVAANGVLFVATNQNLFALHASARGKP